MYLHIREDRPLDPSLPVLEGACFVWLPEACLLIVGWPEISLEEINIYKNGRAEFAVAKHKRAAFFYSRFSGSDWSESPYSWWVSYGPESHPDEPPKDVSKGLGAPLQLIVVDLSTRFVKCLRVMGLPMELTNWLFAAIREQAREQVSQEVFLADVREYQVRFGTPNEAAAQAPVRCKIGS